jgi:DNA (cytosine-5)-methyltransferase 1
MSYKLLDLFCGAGGCSMGYHRAGFEVVGVDSKPMPNYPFKFYQADALQFDLNGFDVVHTSPPCQRFSMMGGWSRNKKKCPDLVDKIRTRLIANNKPFVIENVIGAPLLNPIMLCGTMFNLGVIRHRLFEIHPFQIEHSMVCDHSGEHYTVLTKSCRPTGDMFAKSSVANGRKAMGIDWMTQYEMGEAIPPSYTEFIGKQLIVFLNMESGSTAYNSGKPKC